jgi:peroxiredoxin Q/BCP
MVRFDQVFQGACVVSLEAGTMIADFNAEGTSGPVTRSSLEGRTVVIYFYPKDNTPGCTNEAADFRDLHAEFVAANAVVLGVSRDSLRSHQNFRAKLELPFDLIADVDESLCTAFDVIKMKNMYGKQVRGIERSTFLIDRTGVVARVWRGVKVAGHAQQVLDAARAL